MVLLKQAEACPFIETMVANTALNVLIVMTTIVMSYVYFLFGKKTTTINTKEKIKRSRSSLNSLRCHDCRSMQARHITAQAKADFRIRLNA